MNGQKDLTNTTKNICKGFVYRWTNNVNSKWYIGSHSGATDDGYIGNGVLFKKAINKYGIESFTRTLLYQGTDFRAKEAEYLVENDAADNQKSYNLKNTSEGGSHKGHKKSDTTNMRKAKLGKNNPSYQKVYSDEERAKISEGLKKAYANGTRVSAQKGKPSWNKGIIPKTLTCPHCDKSGKGSVMYRHHFDRCKEITKDR